MKLPLLALLLLSALGAQTALAAKDVTVTNHCVCEIGDYKPEKKFYKMGCNIWFNKSKCDTRKTIDLGSFGMLDSSLEHVKSGDKLTLGFVGHWLSSMTEPYIEKQILPVLAAKNIEVVYDNTACSPMGDAPAVQEYLNTLDLNEGQSLTVKGSQSLSLGLWDDFTIGKNNFYAHASTLYKAARYPSCKSFENKGCSKKFQSYETGTCVDTSGPVNKLAELQCQQRQNRRSFAWLRN